MQTHNPRSGILEEKIATRCIENHPRTEQISITKIILLISISFSLIILSIGTSFRIAHPSSDVNFNLTKK